MTFPVSKLSLKLSLLEKCFETVKENLLKELKAISSTTYEK